MQSKKNVLWLVPQLPWPLHSGDKLRSYNLALRVAKQHAVTMLAPVGKHAAAEILTAAGIRVLRAGKRLSSPFAALAGWQRCLPATVARYSSGGLRCAVRELVYRESFDVIYLDHLAMTGVLAETGPLPLWLDEHNLESLFWARFASARGPLWRAEARRVRDWERVMLSRMRGVAVTSDDELKAARELQPAGTYVVVPNATDVSFWRTLPRTPTDELLLTGSLDWPPNREGIIWFINNVWREARALGLTARIVGSNPPLGFIKRCTAAAIRVDANVSSLQPYYQRSRAVLVPLRVGAGTRLRVIEAFAARVPVIASTLAMEGLRVIPGKHYLPADTPQQMLASLRLTEDATTMGRITEAALTHAATYFDWEQSAATVVSALERLG